MAVRETFAPPSRFAQVRASLTRKEWTCLAAMAAVIIGLHLLGWFTLMAVVAPHHYSAGGVGGPTLGIGVGITAYTLGMRHAFDADHIAAIDNTTRKLMADGKRPLSVGFWFSLGHSSIVFGLALLLSLGLKHLVGPIKQPGSTLHHYTGLIGTSVSGAFLYVIAILNVVVLGGIVKVRRKMKSGEFDEALLEEHLDNRGLVNRLLGGVMKTLTKPWQMYPIGMLFGLGFDTATEVALLVLAGTASVAGLPWYAILCLPVLFAAGMSLLDTIDGSFMNFAYGWAFSKPVRKIYYNITVTGLSAGVALLIGTVELLQVLSGQLGWTGGFWAWTAGLDLNTLGFVIVGLFVLTWVGAIAYWHWGNVEERWSAPMQADAE